VVLHCTDSVTEQGIRAGAEIWNIAKLKQYEVDTCSEILKKPSSPSLSTHDYRCLNKKEKAPVCL